MPRDKLIQPRKGTAAQWIAANPVLAEAEFGYETDTKKMKMGDGLTDWDSLGYVSTWGSGGGGGASWGSITGTLSDQTDLQAALNAKANASSPTFTGTVTLPDGQVVNGVTLTAAGSASSYLRADGTYGAPSASVAWGGITGTLSDQTDLNSALNAKAPLASPAFTGTATITTMQATSSAGITIKSNSGSDVLHLANGGVNATAYGGWNFDGATANTIASFGASKTLTSLSTSTYPNLTELSYVKGVTSAIQTQMNAKAPLANPTFTGTVTLPAGQVVNGVTLTTGGGTTNFLRADGTYAAPPSGGSPAWGSITGTLSSQTDLNTALGLKAPLASPSFTGTVGLTGVDTGMELTGITNEPSAPSAGVLRMYSKSIAGRMIPKIKGPSGVDMPLQVAFWGNNITMWNPTSATAGLWIGTVGAGAGSVSTPTFATTSIYTTIRRTRWANVVTTTNQVLGQRNTEAMYFRGNTAGQGGFFFFARMGFDVWTNGGRMFVGFATGTTVISANPSSLNNTVGFCIDSGDAGAISFLTRDTTTPTKQPTGLTAVSGKGYDCYIFAPPNGSSISYRIVDINTGTEYSNTTSSTLPTATTGLTANVLASNAALTTATSIQIGLNKIYVETDY